MRTTLIIVGLALQAAQAGGNTASLPDSSGRRESADLDFLTYDPAYGDGKPSATAPDARPARAWMYWAAAGAAACGGLGWYWYAENSKPVTNRNEQVFTDAP
jgi:hypothetical protein